MLATATLIRAQQFDAPEQVESSGMQLNGNQRRDRIERIRHHDRDCIVSRMRDSAQPCSHCFDHRLAMSCENPLLLNRSCCSTSG